MTDTTLAQAWAGRDAIRILAVEDEEPHRELLREIFEGAEFRLTVANNGMEALEWLDRQGFDVVLLDNNMPGMTGLELLRVIRSRPDGLMLPLIMVTAMNSHFDLDRGFKSGADDFVGKPYSPIELMARVRSAAYRKWATDQLDHAEVILFALAHIVEARDSTTGRHCARLAHISQVFGRKIGLSQHDLLALRRGAVLHDIGKLVVPDAILNKAGPLDEQERQIMSRHSIIGAELCKDLSTMHSALPVIRHHHERFDGQGYPDGLAGEAIPLLARLFQIVDIFDALSNKRPYKEALSLEKTLEILAHGARTGGSDPELMRVFSDIATQTPHLLTLPEQMDGRGEAIFHSISTAGLLKGTRFDTLPPEPA